MLESSSRGYSFPVKVLRAREKLIQLTELNGMVSILNFLDLMNGTWKSGEKVAPGTSEGFSKQPVTVKNERIKSAYQYILDNFTRQDLKVGDVCRQGQHVDSAFSHFFKKHQ